MSALALGLTRGLALDKGLHPHASSFHIWKGNQSLPKYRHLSVFRNKCEDFNQAGIKCSVNITVQDR